MDRSADNWSISVLFYQALFLTVVSGCAAIPTIPSRDLPVSQKVRIDPDIQLPNQLPCNVALSCEAAGSDTEARIIDSNIAPLDKNTTPERTKPIQKAYSPLIYGAPKPLVCSSEILAEKALRTRPNLQLMWENYLYDSPKGVWAEVGGAVEVNGCLAEEDGGWRNACTVRLSHMLNKAGHEIPYIKGQTVSGRDGGQYFFRLDDAQAYLMNVFGTPDFEIDDASGHWIDTPNEPGLLIMKFPGAGFTGHTTIWNGAGTVDGVDVVGFHILYWKLPCFIPPERKVAMADIP